jgi:hypothetical protein
MNTQKTSNVTEAFGAVAADNLDRFFCAFFRQTPLIAILGNVVFVHW